MGAMPHQRTAFEVRDSRRLTGPNILSDSPGAVLDLAVSPSAASPSGQEPSVEAAVEAAVEAWRRHARRMLDAVGWSREKLFWRRFASGVSLALSAPIDALYSATEVNEWAWEAAEAELSGGRQEDAEADGAAERLRREIEAESNPKLRALQEAARRSGVTFLSDDDHASVGMGAGSRTWPVTELPNPTEVDWSRVHDIPVALVTGTNGKTTTVRLLAAMAAAAGRVPGFSSTGGIYVAGAPLEEGDFAGPGGGRRVLRDRRVEVAILETARGGMLRRGLAVPGAEVAVVTNVAEDHLGEWGIQDLEELTATKLIVARAARRLVVNADDLLLRKRAPESGRPVLWFSLDSAHPELRADGAFQDGNDLVLRRQGSELLRLPLEEVPCTLGGAARHNVANCLGAMAAAPLLGLEGPAIQAGLREFGRTAGENPGRLNRFDLGGVRILVDFAHNPHGMAALMETARALEPSRLLVLLGQAGDRDDGSLHELARATWRALPDLVVLKELPGDLRGREPGEVPRILASALRAAGAPDSALAFAEDEPEAVRQALGWARPGDLLVLVCHTHRRQTLELLEVLRSAGWVPGTRLPSESGFPGTAADRSL